MQVTGCGTRRTSFRATVADSQGRARTRAFLEEHTMPAMLFQFARKLKISRFTIDVLTERLSNLRSTCRSATEEWERFVGRTGESLEACDRLHSELGEQLDVVQVRNTGDIPSMLARFDDLHRRISESIATLNSAEYGTPRAG
jgi:hypothetical protein